MNTIQRRFTLMLAVALVALPASAGDYGKSVEQPDIVDTAIAAGSFETLVTAVRAAGLVETLKSDGPFTVFAPTDEAFAKLPEGTVESLLADKEALTRVLTYHVVPGKLTAAEVVASSSLATAQGSTLSVDTSEGARVGDANIIQTDIFTSNGVIHVIDTVLIP